MTAQLFGIGEALAAAETVTPSSSRGSTGSPTVLRDAKDIVDEHTAKYVNLSICRSAHGPLHPGRGLLFEVLATVAEFKSDLIRARTTEGMQVAQGKG